MSTTNIPGAVLPVYLSNPSGDCPTSNCPTGGTSSGGSSGSNTSGTQPNITNPNTGANGSCTTCPCPDNSGSGSSGSNTSGTHPNVTSPNTGEPESCDCPCLCPDNNDVNNNTPGTATTPGSNRRPTSTCDCTPTGKPNMQPSEDKSSTTVDNILNQIADPVDAYNGAHTISVNLMTLFGGQGLSLVGHYNSADLVMGCLGVGWYHNYEKHLEIKGNVGIIRAYESPTIYNDYAYSSGMTFLCSKSIKRGYVLTCESNAYHLNCNSERDEYYDYNGKLIKVKNHQGFVTSITYDSNSVTITDDVTKKYIKLVIDETGKVTSVTDGLRTANIAYSNDYLVCISDVNGNKLSYSYDYGGRIRTGVDSNNVLFFENTYGQDGRIISQFDAKSPKPTTFSCSNYAGSRTVKSSNRNGDESVRKYNDKGQLIEYTDEAGNKIKYVYDDYGNIAKETDPRSNSIVKEYNSFNKPTKIKDKNGKETVYTYDSKGNVTKITYPGVPNSETFTYDSNNRIIKHIDLRGLITVYTYDANGMPASKSLRKSESDTAPRTVEYSYVNGLLMSETNVKGKVTSYEYNALGQMVKKTDCCENATVYEYDLAGNVTKVTYADGSTVKYTYDGNYQKTSSTDANGNVTEYDYNGNMKNIAVKLPDGNEVAYAYDNEDRLIKETDQANNCTEYTYDKAGRVISKKLPDGALTKYEYDNAGNVVKETTPAGAVITKSYDSNGNLLSAHVEDNDGNPFNNITTSYEYDALNRVSKITKQSCACVLNTTVYVYSPAGDVLSETVTADGVVYSKTYTYDIYGNKLTETDARGNTTKYAYDVCNNLIKVTDALGNVTANTYDALNRLIQVKNARGAIVKYGYDSMGRRTTVTDALGNKVTTTYDKNGNVLKVVDANGDVLKESTFNSLNLPATVTDPAAGTTTYEYNALGKPQTITDPLNNSKILAYNSRGMNISVTEATQSTSTAEYNSLGKILMLCGPNGGKTCYNYDKVGRLTYESAPVWGAIYYEYNALGVMDKVTNARKQVKNITYDSIGRITGYTCPEGTASFTYDKNGNVLTATDSKGTITRTYDALNRVLTYKDTFGKTIGYEYDKAGNLVKLTYPDGTAVRYEYDLNNNLTKVTDWANRVTSYTYDCNNRVIKTVKPDGSTQTNTYDNKQRLTSSITKNSSGMVISGFEYTFDDMGRVFYEKSLAKNEKMCYTYDTLSRVIQRKTINLNDNSETIEAYSYNPAGNICTANGNESFVYSTNNLLTKFNGTDIAYDLDGNMVSSPIGNFSFDSSNRLTAAGTTFYTYDVEGTRIKTQKGEDTTVFTYNVNARLSQLLVKTENGNVTKYVYGLGLIGEETDGEFKTYHFDLRGSTIALTNENSTVTDTFSYDTYGKLKARTGNTNTPFLYNGRDGVMTEDNGLIYMRARYYSPVLRRFINADKLHGDISNAVTLNRYAFANCNPVANIDPLGLSAERGNGSGYYFTALDPNTVYYYEDPNPSKGLPKWLCGALNAIGGTSEMLAGAALGGTLGWTGWGAYLAGLLIVDGAGRTTQGTAQIVNDIADSNIMYEGNIPRDCTVDVGRTIGGDSGAAVAGMAYDATVTAANVYSFVYMWNTYHPPKRNDVKVSTEEIATSGSPNHKGAMGEQLAGIDTKAKVRIEVNGRVRIPDALSSTTLTEVKNVKYLSNTLQMRDFADYANMTERELELFVRPTTRLSKGVIDAGWDIKHLW